MGNVTKFDLIEALLGDEVDKVERPTYKASTVPRVIFGIQIVPVWPDRLIPGVAVRDLLPSGDLTNDEGGAWTIPLTTVDVDREKARAEILKQVNALFDTYERSKA